jgi:hypothetical protein
MIATSLLAFAALVVFGLGLGALLSGRGDWRRRAAVVELVVMTTASVWIVVYAWIHWTGHADTGWLLAALLAGALAAAIAFGALRDLRGARGRVLIGVGSVAGPCALAVIWATAFVFTSN